MKKLFIIFLFFVSFLNIISINQIRIAIDPGNSTLLDNSAYFYMSNSFRYFNIYFYFKDDSYYLDANKVELCYMNTYPSPGKDLPSCNNLTTLSYSNQITTSNGTYYFYVFSALPKYEYILIHYTGSNYDSGKLYVEVSISTLYDKIYEVFKSDDVNTDKDNEDNDSGLSESTVTIIVLSSCCSGFIIITIIVCFCCFRRRKTVNRNVGVRVVAAEEFREADLQPPPVACDTTPASSPLIYQYPANPIYPSHNMNICY